MRCHIVTFNPAPKSANSVGLLPHRWVPPQQNADADDMEAEEEEGEDEGDPELRDVVNRASESPSPPQTYGAWIAAVDRRHDYKGDITWEIFVIASKYSLHSHLLYWHPDLGYKFDMGRWRYSLKFLFEALLCRLRKL